MTTSTKLQRQTEIRAHAEATAATDYQSVLGLPNTEALLADLNGDDALDCAFGEVEAKFGRMSKLELAMWVTHYNDIMTSRIQEG